MATEQQLGQMKRIATLRHRRAERALERASAERRIREEARNAAQQALITQQQVESVASDQRAAAPACAQTRLWHGMARDQRIARALDVDDRAVELSEAEQQVAVRRQDMVRADHRQGEVSKLHRRAVLSRVQAQEDKDAEDHLPVRGPQP